MYESLIKEIDWEHNHPKGSLFHAAASSAQLKITLCIWFVNVLIWNSVSAETGNDPIKK
jgi:hypothetical protein